MKHVNLHASLLSAALAAAAIASTGAWAQSPPTTYGPGMMGGYGPGYGMRDGYGPAYGGPGYGMGPGMMGGYGPGERMGPGMMGGYGSAYDLNLSAEQRGKIRKIQDDVRRKHWDLMGKIQDEESRMVELYNAEKRDDAALSAGNRKIAELRQQMFDASLDARKQMDAVLSKEQRDKLRRGG